jgi:hypothetical protein
MSTVVYTSELSVTKGQVMARNGIPSCTSAGCVLQLCKVS